MLPSEEPGISVPPSPTPDKWQRLHPLSPIISVNPLNLFLLFTLVSSSSLVSRVVDVGNLFLLAPLLVLAVGWRVIRYLRFSYRLIGNELTVRSGVFVQNVRTLPADRVQQVNMTQMLRHRAFRVFDVNIEIASESDVTLSVLSVRESENIRAGLSTARHTPSTDAACRSVPGEATIAEELYRQPNGHLIRWFVVPSLVVAAVFFVSVAIATAGHEPTDDTAVNIYLLVAVSAMATIASIAIALTNIANFWHIRLERDGDELRLLYGLLTQQTAEVPRARVQALTESLSLRGRMVGVVNVTVHNASNTSGNATYFPAVPVADCRNLTGHLASGLDIDAPLRQHPRSARHRAIFRRVVSVAILVTVVFAISHNLWSLVLIPLAVPWGWRAWVVLGHGETDDVVIGRRGVWKEVTDYVRRDRVQSAAVTANWFQRRLGLATLRIDVAQPLGKVKIVDMATHEADRLLDRL